MRRGGASMATQSKDCCAALFDKSTFGSLGSRLKQPCAGPASLEDSLAAELSDSDFVVEKPML